MTFTSIRAPVRERARPTLAGRPLLGTEATRALQRWSRAVLLAGVALPLLMIGGLKFTAIEVRAPTMIIENMSRPKWSVPSQLAAEGGFSRLGMFCAT